MGFGKDGTGVIIREVQTIALATLANQTAIKFSSNTLTEDFRMLKSEIAAGINTMDDAEVAQGLLLGICNGELSVTEISECILADGPEDRNDRAGYEAATRWVKVLSQAEIQAVPEAAVKGTYEMIFRGENGGPLIVSKDRWTYSNPEGWDFFIFNNTGSALVTGSTARLYAQHFGVWVV